MKERKIGDKEDGISVRKIQMAGLKITSNQLIRRGEKLELFLWLTFQSWSTRWMEMSEQRSGSRKDMGVRKIIYLIRTCWDSVAYIDMFGSILQTDKYQEKGHAIRCK